MNFNLSSNISRSNNTDTIASHSKATSNFVPCSETSFHTFAECTVGEQLNPYLDHYQKLDLVEPGKFQINFLHDKSLHFKKKYDRAKTKDTFRKRFTIISIQKYPLRHHWKWYPH